MSTSRKLSKEELKAAEESGVLKTLKPPTMTIAEMNEANRLYWSDEPGRAEIRLMDAQLETDRLYQRTRPLVEKDEKEQFRKSLPRRSRMPKLDAWLEARSLAVSNDVLFKALPEAESGFDDLYRDDDRVMEVNDKGKEHSITRAGFDTRVTRARKRH